MLADQLDYVVGVDSHRDSHAVAVVAVPSGVVAFEAVVAASSDGYEEALWLAATHAPGRRAFAIEGTASTSTGRSVPSLSHSVSPGWTISWIDPGLARMGLGIRL